MLKSSGVRAMPPGVVNTGYLLSALLSGMSPGLGRKPYKFVYAAGFLQDPIISVPSENGIRQLATAADAPPLEPPGDRLRSYGLEDDLNSLFFVCDPIANSAIFDFPIIVAPCCFKFFTINESFCGNAF